MIASRGLPFFRRRRRGFSLAEVLIALVIFAIGIYGVLDLATNARRIHGKYDQRFDAVVVAESRMALLRAAGYAALAAERAADQPALPLKTDKPCALNPHYLVRVTLEDAPGLDDALSATVTVTWNPEAEKAPATEAPVGLSVSLSEIIAPPPATEHGLGYEAPAKGETL